MVPFVDRLNSIGKLIEKLYCQVYDKMLKYIRTDVLGAGLYITHKV